MGMVPFGSSVGLRRCLFGVVVHVEPPSVLGRPIRPRTKVAVNVLKEEGAFIVVGVEGTCIGEDGGLVCHHVVGDRRTSNKNDNDDNNYYFLGGDK